ncbi:MAG TPA: FAD binding domain-containing protein [Syntrophorhabdaceae bacterium]|nr:FAD binding domain-containing protein [Syntrophorhabdaceae bacterium]
MKPFKHFNARSIKEATELLSRYEGTAKINAGGTDLLGAMRDKCLPVYPEALINVKTIDGLKYVKTDKKEIKIGALTKLADIAGSPELNQEYPLLAEAAHLVASPHIRNMATIGGNLAQDVRCWYYRYPAQVGGPITCLRKGGKICSALGGDNRYHSIFGGAAMTKYPCASHCPAGTDIPAYINKVRAGNFDEAARVLLATNPLPAITGRICPVYCEPHCNRQEFDQSVGINCIERSVGDYVLSNTKKFYAGPHSESGKKIAIIGSGPAGLTAAYYLRTAGYAVTVFEKAGEAGGMLRFSIPPFRLPKKIVKKQVAALEGMGITFKLGISVGKDISIKKLSAAYDAVLLAGGTWKALKLGVPGENSKGVLYAVDYLRSVNSNEKISLGKTVIVIGGGSVAIDAARTAKRTGMREVHLVCLECRDLTSKDRMLALDSEILQAEEEGVVIHPSLGVNEILVKNGKAAGLNAVACVSVREPDGRFNPQYDRTCTATSLKADNIIVAIGQGVEQSHVSSGVTYSTKGTVRVDNSGRIRGMKNVFAAGDNVTGASTVIQAVSSARETVGHLRKVLKDKNNTEKLSVSTDFRQSVLHEIPRVRLLELPVSERIHSIKVEDMQGVDIEQAQMEASRCFNCACLAVEPSDLALALVALDATIVTSKRSVPAEQFFSSTATKSNILEHDELIREIVVPKPEKGTIQKYEKFTLRKPIDFGIVSVASVVTMNQETCRDARIVLGAVAPEPLRARAAEEFLKGKTIDEKTAFEAGKLALQYAQPLHKNEYKIRIAETLVKRVLIG